MVNLLAAGLREPADLDLEVMLRSGHVVARDKRPDDVAELVVAETHGATSDDHVARLVEAWWIGVSSHGESGKGRDRHDLAEHRCC